ncbi:hypothetical protein CVT25_003657 [Psilocybe cyanescens]|uniref:Uncharacterized protein n=1 Tax=Psilocybe cyanescens TaxID=93625 RepID=A0A409WP72_PSICY|nr:hypothetical protein CVT25_003657 [Psilocybe cyanescens]
MIDVKGAPPDYVASTPIELRPQQSNSAAHKAYFTPAPPSENLGTSSGGGQPVVVEDDAAIGTRYQAELLARCARGNHQPVRKFRPCGIITAIFLFPVGLTCLYMDSEKRCTRCGEVLS